MTYHLNGLFDDWADAYWTELVTAYDRDHMDASHDIGADFDKAEGLGVDAYLTWLYSAPKGERLTWGDPVVDELSRKTEFCARLYVCLRDEGLVKAIYMKVRGAA